MHVRPLLRDDPALLAQRRHDRRAGLEAVEALERAGGGDDAALVEVPLLDMLRYHRFLIGALWIPEYGDPDDPEQFEVLAAYSPYHHVTPGTEYPATLISTAESDSRVDPLHARKFAARLQAATAAANERPILVRIETRAGHGVGKPAWKQADEGADTWAFVFWQLGMELPVAG